MDDQPTPKVIRQTVLHIHAGYAQKGIDYKKRVIEAASKLKMSKSGFMKYCLDKELKRLEGEKK